MNSDIFEKEREIVNWIKGIDENSILKNNCRCFDCEFVKSNALKNYQLISSFFNRLSSNWKNENIKLNEEIIKLNNNFIELQCRMKSWEQLYNVSLNNNQNLAKRNSDLIMINHSLESSKAFVIFRLEERIKMLENSLNSINNNYLNFQQKISAKIEFRNL